MILETGDVGDTVGSIFVGVRCVRPCRLVSAAGVVIISGNICCVSALIPIQWGAVGGGKASLLANLLGVVGANVVRSCVVWV